MEITAIKLPTPTAADLAYLAKYEVTDEKTRQRIVIEREVFRRTVACLLAAGYHLKVNDGEDDQTPITVDAELLERESRATDEDVLLCYHPSPEGAGFTGGGFVHFVYGNTGWDVISDHSTRLEGPLQPVDDYTSAISELC